MTEKNLALGLCAAAFTALAACGGSGSEAGGEASEPAAAAPAAPSGDAGRATGAVAAAADSAASDACAPDGEIAYVCGLENAEDIVAVGDTGWLVASRLTPLGGTTGAGGMYLIDARAKLIRESADPPGGVIAHAAPVLDAIERWRAAYVNASTAPGTQVGPAAGVGSLTSGLPDKPDLFPALLEAGIYVVTVPGADPERIAATLREEVEAACANGPLASCKVEVDIDEIHPSAATSPDAPIVQAARTAWRARFGEDPPPITGWTGSTDGVVLRAHGIDTVRLGPASRPSSTDPRCDVFDIETLTTYADLYTRLLSGH